MKTNEIAGYKECAVIPQLPDLNKPYLVDGQYWMESIYYGESMQPGLIPGDRMILKKKPLYSSFNGDICMIQLGDISNAIMCRIYEGPDRDSFLIKEDSPRFEGDGQIIPIKNIVGVWELISSHRAHSFSYSTVKLPIFQS